MLSVTLCKILHAIFVAQGSTFAQNAIQMLAQHVRLVTSSTTANVQPATPDSLTAPNAPQPPATVASTITSLKTTHVSLVQADS